MSSSLRHLVGVASLVAVSLSPLAANAAIVGNLTDVDFTNGSTTFSYLGGSFTLLDNGSGFPSDISAFTGGNGLFAKDFFGISVFFDPPRDSLIFDDSYLYASYPSATVLSFSSLPTIIGLAVTARDGVHYGYAEFVGTLLEGYAFESDPGVGIAALAEPVPEPESLALFGLGIAALAVMRKWRR